jgi:uncharacterized repeat protein (TIGR01451 family)
MFTYPDGESGTRECPVSVNIKVEDGARTLQESTPGSCSGTITLSQTGAVCGNGNCEAGETCDTNGNIRCPAGTPLPAATTCSTTCTYCGDGNVDPGEACDTAVLEGNPDYVPLCQDGCTIGTADDADLDDEDEPDDSLPDTAGSGSISITQQVPQCLEMVSPNNIAPITITVTNGGSAAYLVRAVSDSLPKGLAYQTGSSVINSTANTADTGVVVETTGDSQLITWNNSSSGWTIPSGGTLTIRFSATAGSAATMGAQTNRVTVTPADANPVASQSPILLSQTRTQPQTGIFNRNAVIILTGSIFLIIAGAAFYTGFGTKEVSILMEKTSTGTQDLYLRLTRPHKYMEQNIEKSALKKIHQHTDDAKRAKKKDSQG